MLSKQEGGSLRIEDKTVLHIRAEQEFQLVAKIEFAGAEGHVAGKGQRVPVFFEFPDDEIKIQEGETQACSGFQDAVEFLEEAMQLLRAQAPADHMGAITKIGGIIFKGQVQTIGAFEFLFPTLQLHRKSILIGIDQTYLLHPGQ